MTLTGERFFVSVRGETADEVIEKFGPSQWAPGFGMLTHHICPVRGGRARPPRTGQMPRRNSTCAWPPRPHRHPGQRLLVGTMMSASFGNSDSDDCARTGCGPYPATGTWPPLSIYVRLGEETSARITAENDEHHRRHRR